ncbi:MAG: hypothetical protein WDW38_010617 [Sanguina aurantia]
MGEPHTFRAFVSLVLRPVSPLHGGGFLVAFAQICTFYYIAACALHFVLPSLVKMDSIQPRARKQGEARRDAFYSIGPLAVKALVWSCVEALHTRGYGMTYEGPLLRGGWREVLYIVASVALLDVLHDTWFYLTHRLLHWGPLYRHVHYIHHKSKAPSAFTGYSFHVLEAALVFTNEVLVCFMFPIHVHLHRVYHLLTTIIHEAGHAGYELAPFIPTVAGLLSLAVHGPSHRSATLNTVQHHDWHHRFPTKHFSLYFTHWDRWGGSMHPEYDAKVLGGGGPWCSTRGPRRSGRQERVCAGGQEVVLDTLWVRHSAVGEIGRAQACARGRTFPFLYGSRVAQLR